MDKASLLAAETLYTGLVTYYTKFWKLSSWNLVSKDNSSLKIVLEQEIYVTESARRTDDVARKKHFKEDLMRWGFTLFTGRHLAVVSPPKSSKNKVQCEVSVTRTPTLLSWNFEISDGLSTRSERKKIELFELNQCKKLGKELEDFTAGTTEERALWQKLPPS
jgi:hypothetical protein